MSQFFPTFAIVTPSFNQGDYLEYAINSVLSQEGAFFINYTIMDGGSTDHSIHIIKKFDDLVKSGGYPIKCKGFNFSWESGKDNGQYDALNKGFRRTPGEIMAWINSDDLYLPNAFKTVTTIFSEFPEVQWITGNATVINKNDSVIEVDSTMLFPRALITKGLFNGRDGRFIQQESTFWRRDLWEHVGGRLNTEYIYASDFELWTRFAEIAELVKVNTQLGAFRKHGKQKTTLITNYDRERESIKNVSFYYKMYVKLMRLLSRVYLLDSFFLLNHSAYLIFFSPRESMWLMRKVRGKIRQGLV